MTLHDRIRISRGQAQLTQSQLADKVGVSLKAVSDWETGSTPRPAVLNRVAAALNVSVDYLLGVKQIAPGASDVVEILRMAKRELALFLHLGDDEFELVLNIPDRPRHRRDGGGGEDAL